MDKKIKKQIERELAKCNAEMAKSIQPNYYQQSRACMLRLCLRDGIEVVVECIKKNMSRYTQHTGVEWIKADTDMLSDILTKWATWDILKCVGRP